MHILHIASTWQSATHTYKQRTQVDSFLNNLIVIKCTQYSLSRLKARPKDDILRNKYFWSKRCVLFNESTEVLTSKTIETSVPNRSTVSNCYLTAWGVNVERSITVIKINYSNVSITMNERSRIETFLHHGYGNILYMSYLINYTLLFTVPPYQRVRLYLILFQCRSLLKYIQIHLYII